MQIDFHHAVTYVVARLAGLDHRAADIVACAAQYVDDATNSGLIRFDNGAMYSRVSSAHRMLDYRNFQELANHHVWLPFHFLPGNGGLPAGQAPEGPFATRLVCVPDSPIAKDMVARAVALRDTPDGLHRLGITVHTYVDTWAHQGFAGISNEINLASELEAEGEPDLTLMERLSTFFVTEANPLGHGTVLSNPDKPYLRWAYVNSRGERVERDNPRDFLAAAEAMCVAIQRFILKDPAAVVPGLPPADRVVIGTLLRELREPDPEVRHAAWFDEIRSGRFSFGRQELSYVAKGERSWKHAALGTVAHTDCEDDRFPYGPAFLISDWKRFHDALQAHRLELMTQILPRYAICAA